MFSDLSKRLLSVFSGLKNRGILTPEVIDSALREVRISLLEADVALPVVRNFILSIKEKLDGTDVIRATSPEQTISKYVHDEIVNLLGDSDKKIGNGNILMCGLQGSGKTTTSAKLANMLIKKHKKKVMLVSLDTQRPAAIDQLEKLASKNSIPFWGDVDLQSDTPITISKKAMKSGLDFDIVIFDTAGRLYIDDPMMNELLEIMNIVDPKEKFLVVDSMMGQDALNTAKVFNANIGITGLIMTKIDGDNRGGACLSAKSVVNCCIRYTCSGEKISDIEEFHGERVASRILDNGDVLSLVEQAMDLNSAEDLKLKSSKRFNMNDMEKYFIQLDKMGGIKGFLRFLPGMGKIKDMVQSSGIDEKITKRQVSIIRSMTVKERLDPKILNASRRRRIAAGAGVHVADVNKLIKQYEGIKHMLGKMGNPGSGNWKDPMAMMNRL